MNQGLFWNYGRGVFYNKMTNILLRRRHEAARATVNKRLITKTKTILSGFKLITSSNKITDQLSYTINMTVCDIVLQISDQLV